MEITRDMDSFEVFHLPEDATDEVIKKEFIFHVEHCCGEDGNKQNANGEYLFSIYQEHYRILKDPEKRAELIEKRRLRLKNSSVGENLGNDALHDLYKNALVVSNNLEEKQKYIITSMNQEIVRKYSQTYPKRPFSLKKFPLKNVYVVVGEDCSLLFTNSVYGGDSSVQYDSEKEQVEISKDRTYALEDCFTDQNIFGTDRIIPWYETSWNRGEIFYVQGVPSFAFLASKIFPNSLVHHGKVKDCDFRQTYDIISNYLHEHSAYVASFFDSVREAEEEEKDKKKKKSK